MRHLANSKATSSCAFNSRVLSSRQGKAVVSMGMLNLRQRQTVKAMNKINLAAAEKAVTLAYFQCELANNPELERHIKAAVDLRQQLRQGAASLPAVIDLSRFDAETAELLSAFILAVSGC